MILGLGEERGLGQLCRRRHVQQAIRREQFPDNLLVSLFSFPPKSLLRFTTERTLTVNTAAVGGNLALLGALEDGST